MDESQEEVLAKCDLAMVRDEIIDVHRMMNAEAAKNGEEAIFRNEYAAAWCAFRDRPTIATAQALLTFAPQLSEYFAMCSPGHEFYERARFLKARRMLNTR
jgi:hypothetical protein